MSTLPEPTKYIGIKLTVLPDTSDDAIRVVERLATVVTGLALDGIDSDVAVTQYVSEDEDSDVEAD